MEFKRHNFSLCGSTTKFQDHHDQSLNQSSVVYAWVVFYLLELKVWLLAAGRLACLLERLSCNWVVSGSGSQYVLSLCLSVLEQDTEA